MFRTFVCNIRASRHNTSNFCLCVSHGVSHGVTRRGVTVTPRPSACRALEFLSPANEDACPSRCECSLRSRTLSIRPRAFTLARIALHLARRPFAQSRRPLNGHATVVPRGTIARGHSSRPTSTAFEGSPRRGPRRSDRSYLFARRLRRPPVAVGRTHRATA